jgi:5-hydroxyisourate hydrolase
MDHGMKVTVHVVDSALGRPAEGVSARLERQSEGTWTEQARQFTDMGGQAAWEPVSSAARYVYRLELDLDAYFSALGIVPSHPRVIVVFRVLGHADDEHIHVMITPHAQMTYQVRH